MDGRRAPRRVATVISGRAGRNRLQRRRAGRPHSRLGARPAPRSAACLRFWRAWCVGRWRARCADARLPFVALFRAACRALCRGGDRRSIWRSSSAGGGMRRQRRPQRHRVRVRGLRGAQSVVQRQRTARAGRAVRLRRRPLPAAAPRGAGAALPRSLRLHRASPSGSARSVSSICSTPSSPTSGRRSPARAARSTNMSGDEVIAVWRRGDRCRAPDLAPVSPPARLAEQGEVYRAAFGRDAGFPRRDPRRGRW